MGVSRRFVLAALAVFMLGSAAVAGARDGNQAGIPEDLFIPYTTTIRDFYTVSDWRAPHIKAKIEALEHAAARGDAKAKFNLGVINEYQWAAARAAELYEEATEAGVSAAMVNLAVLYMYGSGVRQNLRRAIGLYQRAAELEDMSAFQALSIAYEYGYGVPQNFILAHAYANVGAVVAPNAARPRLMHQRDAVARRMTPDQIAIAQNLALTWKPGLLFEDTGRAR